MPVEVEVEILDDPARACAAMLVGVAAGGGHICLTGGSTPRDAYREFVQAVSSVGVDVSGATMWFGDERCVPPEDPRSNYGMVYESMLAPLRDLGLPVVHRIKGELGPDPGADEYERELHAVGAPEFDLMLLGIGPDGHCASLFPDQPSLSEHSRLVVGVHEAGLEPFVPRVSLTLPALVNSRHIVFLATGESKADAVSAAFGPRAKPDPHVPSSLVASEGREVTVLLDRAAASRLDSAGERA